MGGEEFLDPCDGETHPIGEPVEQIGDESAEFLRALDDQRRGFPVQTLPNRLDRVQIRRANRKEDQSDP